MGGLVNEHQPDNGNGRQGGPSLPRFSKCTVLRFVQKQVCFFVEIYLEIDVAIQLSH